MHLVTKSYFDAFIGQFQPPFDAAKNFEAFANYCVFSKCSADKVEVVDIVYEGADPGIDGAMLFLDDRAVFSAEELREILSASRREFDVTVILTQVKSSQSWRKVEVDSFISAIVDLLGDAPAQPHAPYLADFRASFRAVFENIGRVRNGRPNLRAYFLSAAPNTDAPEILAAFAIGKKALAALGYFHDVDYIMAHREELHSLWLGAGANVEAQLATVGYVAFPEAPSINNAYVATVHARDFIDAVLKNPDGTVRKKLFEENVRDFLGVDAEVNSEISQTISNAEKRMRFGLMNNGITIVASVVRPSGQAIFLRDFQIVNGCQTSNILISRDSDIARGVSLMVKLIEASDPVVIDDIVRATNRQSKVEDAQFASTLAALRDIENYFHARGRDETNRLYFERRKGQYGPENIPAVRIFDVREVARCYAAIFIMRPDLASRYPNRLTSDLLKEVFKPGISEEHYYAACFCHYRLKMLIGNRKFDQRYSKLRWHIMCAASKLCGAKFKEWSCQSKEEALYKLFAANEGQWFDTLAELIATSIPEPDLSRDLLKSPPLTASILANVDALI